MGQFFFLKYTVVYGLALTWTRAEGYCVPQPPKCVACICLYSDMWRLFDEGLYLFIHRSGIECKFYGTWNNSLYESYLIGICRYIYQPCLKTSSRRLWGKLSSSCLCFLFVFIWHGLHDWVFMWSFLNFCGIVVERVAGEISKTRPYLKFKVKHLYLIPRGYRYCVSPGNDYFRAEAECLIWSHYSILLFQSIDLLVSFGIFSTIDSSVLNLEENFKFSSFSPLQCSKFLFFSNVDNFLKLSTFWVFNAFFPLIFSFYIFHILVFIVPFLGWYLKQKLQLFIHYDSTFYSNKIIPIVLNI